MTPQDNKAVALRFLGSFGEGEFQETLLAPDATFWSARAGVRTREHFVASLLAARALFSEPVRMTITSTTAEDDRVSIEANGESRLKGGKPYNNVYHFMFVLRDGQILRVREHCNTQLSIEALGDA